MHWTEDFFIKNAKLYAPALEAMEKEGIHEARLIRNFLKSKGFHKANVIDIPCGTGRVSVPLAKHYNVTGVDISPYFLNLARKRAMKNKVVSNTQFLLGNMWRLDCLFKKDWMFDVAINEFTSIGYGSEVQDMIFFRSLRKLVKENGIFIINRLMNKEYRIRNFSNESYDGHGNRLPHEVRFFDKKKRRIKSKEEFYEKRGRDFKFLGESTTDLRIYSPRELTKMLLKSGWRVTNLYDNLESKRRISNETHHFTAVAKPINYNT